MRKELLDFLNGVTNAVRLEDTILSRDVLPNGYQRLVLNTVENDATLFEWWHNPKEKRNKNDTPKHTGGKKPYIMLITGEVENLRKQGIPNLEELIGFLVCLGNNIEWHSGRLINKRSKKSLKYKDIQKLFSGGRKKLDRILRELKEHDLLFSTEEGYFISTRIIKKGKTKKEGR